MYRTATEEKEEKKEYEMNLRQNIEMTLALRVDPATRSGAFGSGLDAIDSKCRS